MPRPIKSRRVEKLPENTYFKPIHKKKCELEEVILKIEELEAMRLKDVEGLTQEECAEKMYVSRQTFQNIIDSARYKVAMALTKGYAINISGGNYTTKHCKFKCLECDTNYHIKYERDKDTCPNCGSENVSCLKEKKFCKRWCEI